MQIKLNFFYLHVPFRGKSWEKYIFLRNYLHLLNFFCKFAGCFMYACLYAWLRAHANGPDEHTQKGARILSKTSLMSTIYIVENKNCNKYTL